MAIQGLPADGLHNRVLDDHDHLIPLPPEGLVVSPKLAEVLGARVGDELRVEILEGKRPVRTVRLVGLAEDFTGMTAYMDLHALNRLLGEGDVISGASFRVDGARRAEFLRALKDIPRVSWVAIKDSLRENFRQTTAASIGLIQKIYLVFAIVVAFGVVYNNARISLAERARELATLRVIGFSRREVGAVLVTELVVLALIAVPLGLAAGHRLRHGHHPGRQHGDRAAAARAHRQQLRLCRAGRHHRLDALGAVGAAEAAPPRPGQRPESPRMNMGICTVSDARSVQIRESRRSTFVEHANVAVNDLRFAIHR